MAHPLEHIIIHNFTTESGTQFKNLQLSYQLFGKKLGAAPVILVNHALTGNSDVAGENGWWKDIIGIDKTIDTNVYTILSFNIPGNGFDGFLIENYKSFIARDIATIFLIGEETLQKILRQSFNFDLAMAELATGGFAAAVSIFIATFVSESIESKYKTIDHPLIDAMGIILGTIFIILIYKIVFLTYKLLQAFCDKTV